MYEIKSGPLPDGVTAKGSYQFDQMEVDQWFFAPGKKPATIRAAVTGWRIKHDREKKFSCVAGRVDGINGTVCVRVK